MNNFLVAIPVYNEAQTLETVLRQVKEYAHDVLVVDDGSTDGTSKMLSSKPELHKITHVDNRGYGQSLIDAFSFAVRRGYDWLITIDCDEQHNPACIPQFLQEARRCEADIISGTRYLERTPGDSVPPADRQAINQKITDLLNEVLDLDLTDAFCGFKAYRVATLSEFRLTVPGYGMPLQFWVQAAGLGLRIRELSVQLKYNDPNRSFGASLDDPDARLLYYYDVLVHALAEQFRANRQMDRSRDSSQPRRRRASSTGSQRTCSS